MKFSKKTIKKRKEKFEENLCNKNNNYYSI